ncbi:MAG TPA: hypothetical protein VLH39_08070, partial [Magnetospirillaceae bacterium]|nr:hypothetical protein [Magnetospirillaceae bacterium]
SMSGGRIERNTQRVRRKLLEAILGQVSLEPVEVEVLESFWLGHAGELKACPGGALGGKRLVADLVQEEQVRSIWD